MLRWGILGTGSIAKTFAKGLAESGFGGPQAVGSRNMESAETFAREHGGTAYGSYEAVLDNSNVDAVYIALPHHLHHDWTIRSAEAGKHILCEKPFTLNLAEAENALAAVKKADVFFMEAWMYRSHPQSQKLKELVREGAIGEVRLIEASFGYAMGNETTDHFKNDGRYGGGGLLDVGSYPVSFSRMIAGEEPVRTEYAIKKGHLGQDSYGAGVLAFSNGLIAQIACAVHLNLRNTATIYGSQGRIEVPSPWFANGEIYVVKGEDRQRIECDTVPHLWGNQAAIVEKHVADRQSPTMSWEDTLGNMRTLDRMRESADLQFELEKREF